LGLDPRGIARFNLDRCRGFQFQHGDGAKPPRAALAAGNIYRTPRL
jgi:hypothetical protein